MFPLGHALLPAGALYLLRARGVVALDLRLVMLGGLVPDLVDKPLSFLGLIQAEHGHWVGHSLLAGLALLALAALPKLRWALPLALGVLSHALLDRLPLNEAQVWLWPALGPFPAGGFGDPLGSLADPWVIGGEVAGACILAVLVVRERWFALDRALAFAKEGELEAGRAASLEE